MVIVSPDLGQTFPKRDKHFAFFSQLATIADEATCGMCAGRNRNTRSEAAFVSGPFWILVGVRVGVIGWGLRLGLDWRWGFTGVGLGRVGLGWVGLGWVGLGWVGLGWVVLGRVTG